MKSTVLRSPTPIPWWSDEVDRISTRPQYNGSWPYEIRHTRQCGTHAFTPLSSRTNVYKYSYFPTLQNCCRVSTGNGMLFLTQPVQHHLPIPSVQHSTDYPPLHPTPTASSMTLRQYGSTDAHSRISTEEKDISRRVHLASQF